MLYSWSQRTDLIASLPMTEPAPDLSGHRCNCVRTFGPTPYLPMPRQEMDLLSSDSRDSALLTGEAGVDRPVFGMAMIWRVLGAPELAGRQHRPTRLAGRGRKRR